MVYLNLPNKIILPLCLHLRSLELRVEVAEVRVGVTAVNRQLGVGKVIVVGQAVAGSVLEPEVGAALPGRVEAVRVLAQVLF